MKYVRLLSRGAVVLAMLLVCVLGTASADAQTIIYVNAAAPAGGNGASWGTAYQSLDAAFQQANAIPLATRNVQVWIARGRYVPVVQNRAGDARSVAFNVPQNVSLFGSFAGTETSLRDRPLPWATTNFPTAAQATVLSGDLANNDDATGTGGTGENAYRILSASGNSAFEGLIIEGGNANDSQGAYVQAGGALAGSSCSFTECEFRRNRATRAAGAINAPTSGTATVVSRCRFFENDSGPDFGGDPAIGAVYGLLDLSNSVFANNSASGYAVRPSTGSSVVSCTFASESGSIFSSVSASSFVTVNSCVFTGTGTAVGATGPGTTRIWNCVNVGDFSYINTAPFIFVILNWQATPANRAKIDQQGYVGCCAEFANEAQRDFRITNGVGADLGAAAGLVDILRNRRAVDGDGDGIALPDVGAIEQNSTPFPRVLYVDGSRPVGGNGESWATAFKYLPDAVAQALANGGYTSSIWVRRGTYRADETAALPNGSGDRSATFALADGIAIYGGFAGTEAALSEWPALPTNAADAIDPAKATILSGDLNGDDNGDLNRNDNAFHVVSANNVGGLTALDGLTITRGTANNSDLVARHHAGGGLAVRGAGPTVRSCSFTGNAAQTGGAVDLFNSAGTRFENCLFEANASKDYQIVAGWAGGAALVDNSSALFRRCVFSSNVSAAEGGACSVNGGSSVLFVQSEFSQCRAGAERTDRGYGGAVYSTNSNTEFYLCTFRSNRADLADGALHSNLSSASVVNSIFVLNSAALNAGSIGQINGSLSVVNSTFAFNRVGAAGVTGGISPFGQGAGSFACTITSSVFWGNRLGQTINQQAQVGPVGPGTLALTYSTLQGWTGSLGGAGNSGADPQFVRNPGPGSDAVFGTSDDDAGDCRLQFGSPCIDSGNSSAVPADVYDVNANGNTTEALPIDLAGFPRFVDDPAVPNTGVGTPPVDRGAYEAQVNCLSCPGVREWRSAIGGVFDFPSNWTPSVPNSTHDTLFNLNSAYTVSMPAAIPAANLSANSAVFRQGNVAFNLAGGALNLLSVATPSLTVGDTAGNTAQLTLGNSIFNTVDTRIGSTPGSLGVVNVGAGAQLNATRSLTVGFQGGGVLNVSSGGRVFTRDATVGDQATSAGYAQVTGPGSRWDIPFFLIVNNGEVNVSNGGALSAGFGVFLFNDGVITGDGTITGSVVNFGRIAPGNSPGTLTINGSYQQIGAIPGLGDTSGSLVTEINGTAASAFDKLRVTGQATLGGGLYLQLGNNFTPGTTDSFELLRSDVGISRTFDVVFTQALSGPSQARFLRVNYSGFRGTTGGSVRVGTANLPINPDFAAPTSSNSAGNPAGVAVGDFNGDGLPDVATVVPGTGDSPGVVAVSLGQGTPGSGWTGFGPPISYTVGVNPAGVAIADLDFDGKLDVVAANAGSNTLSVLRQNASGGFAPAANFSVGTQSFSTEPVLVAVMRVEGQQTGVAVANRGGAQESGGVTIMRNLSTPGSIQLGTSPNDRREIAAPPRRKPTSVNPFDPDQDKDVDLAVSSTSSDGSEGEAMVLVNGSGIAPPAGSGLPTYPPLMQLTAPSIRLPGVSGLSQVASARLLPGTSQRLADLVCVSPKDNSVTVFANRTASALGTVNDQTVTFAPGVTYALPGGANAAAAARAAALVDMDGDNDPDLAVLVADQTGATRKVYVLRNDSTLAAGTSPEQIAFAQLATAYDAAPAGVRPVALVGADVNGDSRRDLLTVGPSATPGVGTLNVLRNTLPTPALTLGACCRGASCRMEAIGDCTGAGARFIAFGTACNAPGDFRTPCCKADTSQDGVRTIDDLFIYLNMWFANAMGADVDDNGQRTIDDIFIYLNAWFAGC